MQRTNTWICYHCSRAARPRVLPTYYGRPGSRALSQSSPLRDADNPNDRDGREQKTTESSEKGAMSRRLAEMTEEIMETGGRSAQKAIGEAGFSEDLKRQLEEKIAQSSFRAQNQQAISIAETPSSAGAGTRAIAAAQPWTGTETLGDAALRMLDDSHKRLRVPGRAPRIPQPVNLKPAPKKRVSAGERLANARDKTSIYTLAQEQEMTEKQREEMRKELKERFKPGARAMPTTLQGLTSLANERIEDAIARGQFKNIPRGKNANTERDYAASSPFLDTTEYFMNKIIQRQEIVPPWIEKQQELVKAVENFRSRLRSEWRRHAARMIASKGGSLESQIQRARAYALAEESLNPQTVKRESLSDIDSQGNLVGKLIIEQKPQMPTEQVAANEPTTDTPQAVSGIDSTITVTETPADTSTDRRHIDTTASDILPAPAPPVPPPREASSTSPTTSATSPFRDPSWESLERSYHELAIASLNSLARSYNLMAPKVAQKPYYSLNRELLRCYAEVAPQLPAEIAGRARAPKAVRMEIRPHKEGGVLQRFGTTETARVYDERREKAYGFKQFWRDLWSGEKEKAM